MVLAVVLFLVAGLCEIGGGWLVWQVCPWHEGSLCPATHELRALLCKGGLLVREASTIVAVLKLGPCGLVCIGTVQVAFGRSCRNTLLAVSCCGGS